MEITGIGVVIMTNTERDFFNLIISTVINNQKNKNQPIYVIAKYWWNKMSDDNKEIIKSIPNFNTEIFKEITGIEV